MTACTVEFNSANNNGGGVRIVNATPAEVASSTIDFNTAGGFGGGVEVVGGGSPVFRNVTVSTNQAILGGGGFELGTGTSAVVENSTVAFNKSTGTTGIGGGVQNFGSSTTRLESTIVANNSSTSSTGDDISGTLIGKNCLTLDSTGYTFASGSVSNLQGQDPRLDPMLASNGGSTLTHRFLFSNDKSLISPAVDAGSNPSGLTLDQRAAPRTVAILDVTIPRTDIGAFEYQQPPQVLSVTTEQTDPNNPNQQSNVKAVVITFNQVVAFTGGTAVFELRLNPGSASDTVTINSATLEPAGNAVRLTDFSGPLTNKAALVDGNYTLTVKSGETTTGSLYFKGSFFNQGPDGLLDGNGDGVVGDNFVLAGNADNNLFRLFGDVDGDGDVDAVDYGAFRQAFGTSVGQAGYNAAFDYDQDGDIDALDYGNFRAHFGLGL